ncbi:fungal cellulose binding domain protein [Apiospora marii]|uniref:fungal cellulose binding domain protein n=1 Tax=Apiospora marii TaxID=335849 RepID=UPI00312F9D05
MKTTATLSALIGLASLTSAHYTFDKLLVNDVKQGGDNSYIRKHTRGYMPTKGEEILGKDFTCNTNAQAAPQVMTVKPGDKIGFQQAFGANGIEHPGPTQVYMTAAKNGAKSEDGTGDWFKVAQSLICKAGNAESLRSDAWCSWKENNVNFVMPESVPDGEYLVRAEHIALHGAHAGAAEFYYACAQIKVEGSKATAAPGPTTKIPGVYAVKDKAINFSLWGSSTSYPETPGIPVIAGGEIRGSADGKSGDKRVAAAGASGSSSAPATNSNAAAPPAGNNNNNGGANPFGNKGFGGNSKAVASSDAPASSCKSRRVKRFES